MMSYINQARNGTRLYVRYHTYAVSLSTTISVTIYRQSLATGVMIWLTQQVPNRWYVSVTCQRCELKSILFVDPTAGKGEFSLTYFFSCENCNYESTYAANRYWYSGSYAVEVS